MNTPIHTPNAPAAIGPYSQAVQTGNMLFVSGQIPIDPATGAFAGEDIATQTRQSLTNISNILAAAGYSMNDVVKTTVLLADIADFAVVLYDSQGGEGFAKTNAVRKNTAVEFFQLVDNGQGGIFLEVIEHVPDFAVLKAGCLIGENILGNVLQEFVEDIIQGDKVDEVWRIFVVGSGNAVNNFCCNIL